MELGQTIKDIRKENNLTQSDFAEILHVTRQTVSNWENETSYPDLITLVEISDRCDISLDSMLKGDTNVTEKMNRDLKCGKWSKNGSVSFVVFTRNCCASNCYITYSSFWYINYSG